jgi:hypothetical protein
MPRAATINSANGTPVSDVVGTEALVWAAAVVGMLEDDEPPLTPWSESDDAGHW